MYFGYTQKEIQREVMIYKLHSNSFLQEINLNSSILLILLPSVTAILYPI